MEIDERLDRLEEYVRQDTERWQEVHARVDAYRVAFGAAIQAIDAGPAEVKAHFNMVIGHLITMSRQHNVRSTIISELGAIQEAVTIASSPD